MGSVTSAMTAPTPALVPRPRSLAAANGVFTVTAATPVLIEAGQAEFAARAVLLLDLLRLGAGLELPVREAEGPAPGSIFLGRLPRAGAEAYTLDVLPDGVVLRAGGPDGLVWGLQTLRQLLPVAVETPLAPVVPDPGRPDGMLCPAPSGCVYPAGNLVPQPAAPPRSADLALPAALSIPCVRIADEPRFGWRGVLLDCCRHFMDVSTIERVIDLMSLHKLNRLHWHLTEDQAWRLAIAARPRLAEVGAWRADQDGVRYGGFYTQDEARHVVAYAAARGITVVPEIEMPGHSQAALAAYPELGCRGDTLAVQPCWGVWPDVFCAGSEATFAFLWEVLGEVLAIFPSEFIHVGGDECPKARWRECPRCQERIRAEGLADEHELQSWFIRRVERWLAARGRRLIGWDEILEGGLAPGATVQSWRGFAGAVAAARQGHDTVVSPTSHAYFDYDLGSIDLAAVYAYEPVPPELTADEARRVLGGEMNLWTEHAPQAVVDERLFPRLCAMSEVLWSPRPPRADLAGPDVKDPAVVGRDLTDLWRRLGRHYQRLDRLGVQRGYEGRPLTLTAAWDEDREGWLLAWQADARRPDGEAVVVFTIDGADRRESAGGAAWREQPGVIEARLEIDGRPWGAPQRIELDRNLAVGRPAAVAPEPSDKYEARAAHPVTSGILPGGDYRDGRWLAWEGPDAEVVIDLGEDRTFRRAAAVCLHAGGALIYAPERIVFATSRDGAEWSPLGEDRGRAAPQVMARVLETLEASAGRDVVARYVRLRLEQRRDPPRWPWAPDSPPWIFLGQVMIE